MKDKRSCHGPVGKLSSEQHFHKSVTRSPTPSTTRSYGRQAGRWQAGSQTKYTKFSKLAVGGTFDLSLCLTKVQHHYSLTNAFQPLFWVQWCFSSIISYHTAALPCKRIINKHNYYVSACRKIIMNA